MSEISLGLPFAPIQEVKVKTVSLPIYELIEARQQELLLLPYDEYPMDAALLELFYRMRWSKHDGISGYDYKLVREVTKLLKDRLEELYPADSIPYYVRGMVRSGREVFPNDVIERIGRLEDHWQQRYFTPRVAEYSQRIESDWWRVYAETNGKQISDNQVRVYDDAPNRSKVLLFDTHIPIYRTPPARSITYVPPGIELTGGNSTDDIRRFEPIKGKNRIELPWPGRCVDISKQTYEELKESGYVE